MIKLPDEKQKMIDWLKHQIGEFESISDDLPFGLEEDEEMHLKVMRCALNALNATAQPVSDGWIFEACENEPCQNGAVVNVHSADIHLCAACSSDKKYSRMKITALPKRLSLPLPAAPGGRDD